MSDQMTMAQFKALNRKEKIEYIWEYYKWYIIGSIIVIVVIINLLNSFIFNPQPKVALSITFIGKNINRLDFEALENEIENIIIEKETNERVLVDAYFRTGNSEMDMDYATNTKFFANMSINELDILILEKDKFNEFMSLGYLLDLGSVMSEADLNNYEEVWEVGTAEDSTDELIYGLNVTHNDKVKSVIGNNEEKIICIIGNSKRIEKSKVVIKWFMEQEK